MDAHITENDDTLESFRCNLCIYQGEKLVCDMRPGDYNERQKHAWYLLDLWPVYLSHPFTTYISLIAASRLCQVSTSFSI